MENRKHKALIELIPAFVLDCLEPDETQMVERHLATCEICQAELRAYQSVVDILSLAAPEAEPDPSLRQEIMTSIRATPAVDESRPLARRERLMEGLQQSVSIAYWQLVAILLLAAAFLAGSLLFYQSRAADETQFALAEPDGVTNAGGLIVVAENGHDATLIVENLPSLSPDFQYQLWLIEENGARTSGGLFSVVKDGYQSLVIYSDRPFDTYVGFGITVEPWGGSEAPTGEPVLVSN